MEWKEVRLGDVCSIQRGASPRPIQKFISKEGMPWVKIADATGISSRYISSTSEYIIKEGISKSRIVHPGDLIVSNSATPGLPKFMAIEACVHDGWLIIRDLDGIDKVFLYYVFINIRRRLSNQANGSVFMNLKTDIVKDFVIKLPTLDDQRRIASILSSLDQKIELNNKINADLEEMAQAIFKNWFVDFEPFKDGKFVDSELGMIPEGWKVGRLTDVIKLMPGGTPKTSEPLYWDNGTIPFFSPKDVNGVYCFATEKHITEAGLNKCSSNLYPKDTIFITCRGTVGKVCLVACDMAMNQSNYAIKAIDGYSQYYVFFLVKSVVERLIKKSNGAVFSAITSKDFDEEILIPSQNAVEDFTNVIDGFFRRIFTIGTENSRLSLLRDTLLPRLMSGELEVPE